MPFMKTLEWLEIEKSLGSNNPDRIVLATTTSDGIPHSRIVAIREITQTGIVFFTQKGSRKFLELKQNPHASITVWLPLQQREIVMDGKVQLLSHEDNLQYWKTLDRERQVKFSTLGPTSGQIISSQKEIEDKYQHIARDFENKAIPMNEFYCGFLFIPESVYFYTLGVEKLSEIMLFKKDNAQWQQYFVSP